MTLRLRIRLVEGFGFSQRALRFGFVAVAICAMMLASPLWGQNTFPASGNVGIGTTSPLSTLDILGPSGVTNFTGTARLGMLVRGSSGATDYSGIDFYGYAAEATRNPLARIGILSSGSGSYLQFGTSNLYASGITNTAMTIDYNGNVGIGTTTPAYKLDSVGGFSHFGYNTVTVPPSDNTNGGLIVGWNRGNGTAEVNFYNAFDAFGGAQAKSFVFSQKTGASTYKDLLTVQGNGNVGIGTTTPVHPLQVAGIIGAEEVVVSSTGADYVFKPDYRLSPLSEVATYIEQNHHLPGIPSAKEVQAQGVNLGEMQTKLLAKIEELTLHMIQADERNTRLEQQDEELRKRIAALESHAAVRAGGSE